jgi:excisionase family DNA binding protein
MAHSTTRSSPLQRLFSVEEAARILGLSPDKVRDLIRSGRLKSVRIDRSVRVDIRDLEKFIEENKEGGE